MKELQEVSVHRLVIINGMPIVVPETISTKLNAGATVKGAFTDQICSHCHRTIGILVVSDSTATLAQCFCLNCGEEVGQP